MKPTEGTMLTVARVASEEAAASGIADAVELWQLVCTAAQRALDNTPEQLPVLKKAGVVDAGGQGLVYIFEGMLSVLKTTISSPLTKRRRRAPSSPPAAQARAFTPTI